MYISRFQLTNYKSFASTPVLDLTPGFNLITGPNNAGKTALLEAMSLNFSAKPHRSTYSMPTLGSTPASLSEAIVDLRISNDELREMVLVPGTRFYVAVPDVSSEFARAIGFRQVVDSSTHRLIDWLLSQKEYTFRYKLVAGEHVHVAVHQATIPTLQEFSGLNHQRLTGQSRIFLPINILEDKTPLPEPTVTASEDYDFGMSFGTKLLQRVYTFHAQRITRARYPIGENRLLASDASNLAEVLLNLTANRSKFERFNDLLRQILPQVKAISLHIVGSGHVEIRVWNQDPKMEREDLVFSLDESGTGIGQVLAILYVVFTSQHSQTMIIDEPQSFLHRGAARKLLEVLKKNPQHQYIIATHSPTVITATSPSTITLVRQDEGQSTLEILDANEVEQQRRYLTLVGASPADVFGYDNILWVEGETEEICFPKIVERINKHSLMGTMIKGVKHTGDFETRDANLVFEIYDRLSHGKSLLPPAIGFLFDAEGRTEAKKKEMRIRSGDKVAFTNRRMYENHLLNADAIAHVMNETIRFYEPDFGGEWISPKEVSDSLEQKSQDPSYFGESADANDWRKHIHGKKLLSKLFSELSCSRQVPITFDPVRHAPMLTEWLIENKPDELGEIATLISSILKRPEHA